MALDDLLHPRCVELGKIKIGTKGEERDSRSGGKWRPPVKLDHFIITTMNRNKSDMLEEDTALMGQLAGEFGSPDGHLREIPVALLSDDEDDILQCAYVYYGGKKCWARSDGKTLIKFVDTKTKRVLNPPEEVPWKAEYLDLKGQNGSPLFKKHTVFNCVISSAQARWGGVYKFRTTSVITGDQLLGSLRYIKALTGGVLVGMPLRLVVRPMQVAPDGKATTVYVAHLELRGPDLQAIQQKALELAQFQLANKQQLMNVKRDLKRLIVMPGEESEPEAADVAAEFHPNDNGDSREEPEEVSGLLDEAIIDAEHEPAAREPGDEPEDRFPGAPE